MSSFPIEGLRTLPAVERVVHKRSFLKSVQWVFNLLDSQEDFVKEFGAFIQKNGFALDSDDSNGVIVSAIKNQVGVLANKSILIINCPGNTYVNFDVFIPRIVEILEAAEKTGGNQVTATVCLKSNSFEIDKDQLDVSIDGAEINKMLFSEAFLNDDEKSLFGMLDKGTILIQRSAKDTVSKYIVELTTGIISGQKYSFNEALPQIKEINSFAYYAWSYAMNPMMIQSLDE